MRASVVVKIFCICLHLILNRTETELFESTNVKHLKGSDERDMQTGNYLFSLLHRACCRVTQLLHQPLHIYKIYKILHIKIIKNVPTCFGPKTILREL